MNNVRQSTTSSLEPIHKDLSELLGAEHLQRITELASLRRAWPGIIGAMLASHSEPVAIENGNLWIAVDHPVMGQQIRFLQADIRKACFRKAKVRGISRIRTRIQAGAGFHTDPGRDRKMRNVSLSEKKQIVRSLKPVTNPDLRRAIYQAGVAQLAYGEAAAKHQ